MRLLAVLAAALVLAAVAAASPPPRGLVVAGESLGGVRLGMTKAQVLRIWGADHGICRNCRAATWYFTYEKFKPQGAAAEFRNGRVSALWTLWQPAGWHTDDGLKIGDAQDRVTVLYGITVPTTCPGYTVLQILHRNVATW